ncbi:hypothetical protein [Hydrogenophaga sp.]|jgi:hypothetical protein|uniref:hypothetical protein n=1 Tax=Hydrogenophaga sp. TaxID=1904254 RepID=UPI003F6FFC97
MSLPYFRRTLAANRMVFEVRRDPQLIERFRSDLEALMQDYALTPDEREAFRTRDLQRMLTLGVHPYFLTQITRLFHGSAHNHQGSAAIQAYREALVENHKK